ncbi:MAG TPA: RDD family protein [Terracidiphilus sp.]
MSTVGQPDLEPAWKQEVARRLAAHKNRKGSGAQDEAPAQQHAFGSSLAAQAAARVAARYARAKSYSDMQAEEARLAVRAAEIATRVALEAQAVAEEAIAELHAAATEPQRGPAVVESISRGRVEAEIVVAAIAVEPASRPEVDVMETTAETAVELVPEVVVEAPAVARVPEPVITTQIVDGQSFGIRWEPDAPVRRLETKPESRPVVRTSARPSARPEPFELDTEDWWTPAQVSATLRNEPIAVETDPGTANLIAFPREIVATRKMRPRLLEPVQAATQTERQLSIFEVDPETVSTEPEVAVASTPAWQEKEWAGEQWATSTAVVQVSGPEWSGIELDEHPLLEQRPEPEPVRRAQQIFLAPLGQRLMAMAVDGCLILGVFFAAAMMLAARMQQPLMPRGVEMFVTLGVLTAGFVYNLLFMALGVSTPGMRYAGIAFCTFEEEIPTRAQLRKRLGAMVLSLAPVGLGLVWSVFDEDHLSWHDRMSGTYLRKR